MAATKKNDKIEEQTVSPELEAIKAEIAKMIEEARAEANSIIDEAKKQATDIKRGGPVMSKEEKKVDDYWNEEVEIQLFKDKGYESRLLSRSAEDSATVTSVLIPWNSCGMTQATVLKVPTPDYLPYCFFNLISPLMSVLVAAIGYKIFRHNEQESQQI